MAQIWWKCEHKINTRYNHADGKQEPNVYVIPAALSTIPAMPSARTAAFTICSKLPKWRNVSQGHQWAANTVTPADGPTHMLLLIHSTVTPADGPTHMLLLIHSAVTPADGPTHMLLLIHTYLTARQHSKPRWAIRAAAAAECRRPVPVLIAFPEQNVRLHFIPHGKIENGQRKQANNKKI
jgi:hypothetical protein